MAAWDDALADVPLAQLDAAFSAGARAHSGPYMLTNGDVLDAWRGLREQKVVQMRYLPAAPKQSGCCNRCWGMGWLRGEMVQGGAYRDGRALIRCPECGEE